MDILTNLPITTRNPMFEEISFEGKTEEEKRKLARNYIKYDQDLRWGYIDMIAPTELEQFLTRNKNKKLFQRARKFAFYEVGELTHPDITKEENCGFRDMNGFIKTEKMFRYLTDAFVPKIFEIFGGKEIYNTCLKKLPDHYEKVKKFIQPAKKMTSKKYYEMENEERYCSYCCKEQKENDPECVYRTCSHCYITSYCSKECQLKDWENHRNNDMVAPILPLLKKLGWVL